MISEKVKKLLNDQVQKEFYSAYLYLDMSNYYYEKNLGGFGNYFKVQAQEERDHALLFIQYLLNNNIAVKLDAIQAPDKVFAAFADPLTAALAHEQLVTASINAIYAAAHEERDYRTMQFLDWFIKEQGEEEQNASDLLGRFGLFGSDPHGLYLLNAELKARAYAPPSLTLD